MEAIQRRDGEGIGVQELSCGLWLTVDSQIDCAVSSIKPQGVFCEAGPLTVFVSKLVRNASAAAMLCTDGPSIFPRICATTQMRHPHNIPTMQEM